ncbi:molybdopterin molybdotransferase [Mergibacter septicus]|uniref:molybdopterin molybdotransferase MoeA n=1 Tax=Mergibacter septicus TaxID=221402 RepID=UPI00117938EC|nr:molybdopterin molybdotransferase MoeA [Mergibacter septicus]AWX13355.1 molybdopterin molybdotransferase [Mergibacter septicus]
MNHLLSLEQALTQLLTTLPEPKITEILNLNDCYQRICAEDIYSPINVPSFDNSSMDGYAVRLADLQQTMTLTVAGKAFAGQPFTQQWPPLTAVRIMTGAMLPEGVDAVVMQENVTLNSDGSITFNQLPTIGQNIRRIGESVKKDDVVLTAGTKLNAVSLPLLASLGIEKIKVFPKIKVAILSTGDELVPVGQPLKMGQIYDSNRFCIKLMLENLNCEILDFGILPDDQEKFEDIFTQAEQEADVIITSGGVSVGEADFTKGVLEKLGQINFWKLAIKPGKPFAFGKLENAWFFGLPGNPVSALVTFYQLVQPALRKLSGQRERKKSLFLAKTTTKIKKTVGRLDFQRGFYQYNVKGELEVKPVGLQSSHMFNSFVESNCFIILERDRGDVEIGETVTIEFFNELLN